jgi:hypothetical protein
LKVLSPNSPNIISVQIYDQDMFQGDGISLERTHL